MVHHSRYFTKLWKRPSQHIGVDIRTEITDKDMIVPCSTSREMQANVIGKEKSDQRTDCPVFKSSDYKKKKTVVMARVNLHDCTV